MDWFKYTFWVIAFWVLAYLITFNAPKQDKKYLEEGIQVNATISNVQYKLKGTNNYSCTYINENGEQVSAALILNQTDGKQGQVVTGYYLPEDPKTVWCKPNDGFMLILTIIFDALAIGSTLLLIYAFISNAPKKPRNIPDYAKDIIGETNSMPTAQHNPWDYAQSDTWDEQQHSSPTASKPTQPEPENSSGESSTGLKLKL